jgi:hypothetical protein
MLLQPYLQFRLPGCGLNGDDRVLEVTRREETVHSLTHATTDVRPAIRSHHPTLPPRFSAHFRASEHTPPTKTDPPCGERVMIMPQFLYSVDCTSALEPTLTSRSWQ